MLETRIFRSLVPLLVGEAGDFNDLTVILHRIMTSSGILLVKFINDKNKILTNDTASWT
ncbi:MAG: hypothetical protein ACTSRA_04315 [Promethearchaeota archaeon]